MKLRAASLAWKSWERPIFSFWAGTVGRTYTFDIYISRKSWNFFKEYIFFIYSQVN